MLNRVRPTPLILCFVTILVGKGCRSPQPPVSDVETESTCINRDNQRQHLCRDCEGGSSSDGCEDIFISAQRLNGDADRPYVFVDRSSVQTDHDLGPLTCEKQIRTIPKIYTGQSPITVTQSDERWTLNPGAPLNPIDGPADVTFETTDSLNLSLGARGVVVSILPPPFDFDRVQGPLEACAEILLGDEVISETGFMPKGEFYAGGSRRFENRTDVNLAEYFILTGSLENDQLDWLSLKPEPDGRWSEVRCAFSRAEQAFFFDGELGWVLNLTDSSDVRRNAPISFTSNVDIGTFLSIEDRQVKFSYPNTPDGYSADPILTFQMSRDVPEYQQLTNLRCVLADPTQLTFEVSLQRLFDILGRLEDDLSVRLEWQNDDLLQVDNSTLTRKRVFQVQQTLVSLLLSGAETQNRSPQ